MVTPMDDALVATRRSQADPVLTIGSVVETMKRWSMELLEIGEILHASGDTLDHVQSGSLDKELGPKESHRLRELQDVLDHARVVFDDEHDAEAWLHAHNRALAGKYPLSLLKTDGGARIVDDLLTRVEFGVYS